MGCALVIGGILKAIFKFFHFCFTNGWKGFVVLGVIIVFSLVVYNVVHSQLNTPEKSIVEQIKITIPSLSVAPYIVETATRYYYTAEAIRDNITGIVTMQSYWELIGNKWQEIQQSISLDPDVFGNIKIGKRRN